MNKQKRIEAEEIFSILSDTINGANFDDLHDAVYRIVDIAGYRKQDWISVDERLPEEYDTILCFDGSYVQASVFLDGKFIEDDKYEGDPICGVTHWMPLPEPPKMKGGE